MTGKPQRDWPSDDELVEAFQSVSPANVTKVAARIGAPRQSLVNYLERQPQLVQRLKQLGIDVAPRRAGARTPATPRLSRESLEQALLPPNNCSVRRFLDSLAVEDREIVEEALAYSSRDFSNAGLREWLVSNGFPDSEVPAAGAIADHRTGRRPCRCKG